MKTRWIVAVIFVLASVSAARAEGWLPIWNPFATTPARPPAATVVPNQPTLWQRMASGTQQSWNTTTRWLNPWHTPPARKPPISGTRRVESRRQDDQDQTSWLPWDWFGDDEPGPRYDTPSDWLSQPRLN